MNAEDTGKYQEQTDVTARTRFYDGQFLVDYDFIQEQAYHIGVVVLGGNRQRRVVGMEMGTGDVRLVGAAIDVGTLVDQVARRGQRAEMRGIHQGRHAVTIGKFDLGPGFHQFLHHGDIAARDRHMQRRGLAVVVVAVDVRAVADALLDRRKVIIRDRVVEIGKRRGGAAARAE